VLELRKFFVYTFYEVTPHLPACLHANICNNKEDRLIADLKQKDAITVVVVLNYRYFYDEMDKYIL